MRVVFCVNFFNICRTPSLLLLPRLLQWKKGVATIQNN